MGMSWYPVDRVPQLVEDSLEAKRAGHGLSLTEEVVAMAAGIEQLIIAETLVRMPTVYSFNGLTPLGWWTARRCWKS